MTETNAQRAAEIVNDIDAGWSYDGTRWEHEVEREKQRVTDVITAALDEAETRGRASTAQTSIADAP